MLQALFAKRPANLTSDLLSGLTVALALVPEAVAFAMIAKLPLMVGLHAAFLVGLIAAIFGGRPGMISGATGAMAVVLFGLSGRVRDSLGIPDGVDPGWLGSVVLQHVFLAVGLAGLLQLTAGALRLGKFIRMVPHSVMLGFVNGLAIIICIAQFGSFKDPATGTWLDTNALLLMCALVAITMAAIVIVPRLTTKVPAPLIGIVVTTGIVLIAGLNTLRIGDIMDLSQLSFLERLPLPYLPGYEASVVSAAAADGIALPSLWSMSTLMTILPISLVLAAVGLIESLMTMSLIDEITETRGRGNRECIGQGLANVTCGGFAAMGGCAMIGQSMININSGGRGRTSGIAAAVFLLALVLFGGSLIAVIPVAALVGVMFMVVIGTFEWSSLRILHKVPLSDAFVIVAVSAVTVMTDNLALAVGIGVIIAALVFAWKHASHCVGITTQLDQDTKVYDLHGVLFFASVTSFRDIFDPSVDPDEVIIDFKSAKVLDHSGIEAISSLADRYERAGKRLHIRHLSPECRTLLDKAHGSIIDVDALTDPNYRVADDALA